MFVAVGCDINNDDNREELDNLLRLYGFKEVVRSLWESVKVKEKDLSRLKRDIDRITDYYDQVRIYQYPLEETLIITMLKQKRWRRTVVRP
jgi:CRISPR-associated protein Cas2